MPTTFRDLCPDIVLELCNYFSINELYSSFYPNVLPHIFKLLTASHMQLHLSMTNNHRLNTTLLSLIDINKIISLRLSSCDVLFNIFHAVKTLTLYEVGTANSIISVPFVLPSLQRLVLIYSHRYRYLMETALKQAFTRSSLKYLRLQSNDDSLSIPDNPIGQSFSIQQLVINVFCSYAALMFLLNCLPNLRILRIRTFMNIESSPNPVVVPPIIHCHLSLRTLDLVWYDPTIVSITTLLTQFSNLKYCRLSGILHFRELTGNAWHYLITQRCSNLLRMDVNMLVWIEIKEDNFDEDTFFKRINFQLKQNEKQEKLFVLFGNFRRFTQ